MERKTREKIKRKKRVKEISQDERKKIKEEDFHFMTLQAAVYFSSMYGKEIYRCYTVHTEVRPVRQPCWKR